jgi:hypothetical protein
MNKHSYFPYIRIFLLTIVIWVGIFLTIGDDAKTPRDEMLIEVSKALSQLVFLSLAGAFASFLYNQYAKYLDRYKTKLQEDDKNRQDLLNALINVRAEVEKTRRNYRLHQLVDAKEAYRRTIESVLEARLELSQVWHDTLTLQELYSKHSKAIQKGLTGMKIYLDNLVDEYENNAQRIGKLRKDKAGHEIKELPCFGTFITGNGGREYTDEFLKENYRSTVTLMRQELFPTVSAQETPTANPM